MTGVTSGSNWPGTNERSTVKEMLQDPDSKFWEECSKFVKRRVYSKAKNIPIDYHDEIVQDVLCKLARYLPDFHFQCSLKTWLNLIIERCTIDQYRKLQHEDEIRSPLVERDPSDESEYENDALASAENPSTEDIALSNEYVHEAIAALFEYATLHSNPTRDRLILQMVVFEGYTHEQTARAAGCNPPVVGFVVRAAQRYAREKMSDKL